MNEKSNLKLTRHYIFINPLKVYEEHNKNNTLTYIKSIHKYV